MKANELVATLFLSREFAHRAHLSTKSYAQHMALGDFYDEIVGLADEFAEVYQGIYGLIQDIPYKTPGKRSVDDELEYHLSCVEQCRSGFAKVHDRPLQNILDEICALYSRTLYKLRNLS